MATGSTEPTLMSAPLTTAGVMSMPSAPAGFPRSHNCNCDDGFRANGFDGNFADIDECFEEIDLCHVNATCENTFCHYRLQSLEGTDDCQNQANCTNTDGSFNCECNLGWSGKGTHCENIDECFPMDLPHNCHADATCTDTDGSFYCD